MSWLLIAWISVSHFVGGDNVWVELPDESQIVFYHDKNYDYIGTHLAYVCPRTGTTKIETAGGGCDVAIAWDATDIWMQWAPKVLSVNEDGEFIVKQPDCHIFTLWSSK